MDILLGPGGQCDGRMETQIADVVGGAGRQNDRGVGQGVNRLWEKLERRVGEDLGEAIVGRDGEQQEGDEEDGERGKKLERHGGK